MNNTTQQEKRQHTISLQDAASDILGENWGVTYCGKKLKPGENGVAVVYNGERSSFRGLFSCGSVWTCPVCARRIMGARRAEIENILMRAYEREGWVGLFVTVTLSHHVNSRLDELLKALISAWRSVFSGDRTGERRVLARVKAQIKRIEVKYGRNGYHPHAHVLLLVDEAGLSESEAGIFEDELSRVIFSRYARAVERRGMRAERAGYDAHAIKNVAGALAHYVSKLDMSLELTQTETKTSEAGEERHYSMFQLLGLLERGESEIYGRDIAGIFKEYAAATKGKRAVSYSREIKTLLGIEQKPDEVIVEEAEEPKEERVLAVVDIPLWRVVCARKLRAALLDIADSGDEERVRAWLDALEESAGLGPPEPPPWEYSIELACEALAG